MWRTEAMRDSKGERRTEREQEKGWRKRPLQGTSFFLQPGIALLCADCGTSTDRPKLALIYH